MAHSLVLPLRSPSTHTMCGSSLTHARPAVDFADGGLLREVTLHVHPAGAAATLRRVTVNPLATAGKPDVPSGKVNVGVVLDDVIPGSSVALRLCWVRHFPGRFPPF